MMAPIRPLTKWPQLTPASSKACKAPLLHGQLYGLAYASPHLSLQCPKAPEGSFTPTFLPSWTCGASGTCVVLS